MANEKLISDIVRFMKTHSEHYRKDERPGSIAADNGFFLTIEDTHPDGLLKASHEHREKMISFWTKAVIRRFSGAN